MADYTGFKDYFYSRRRWIFALMAFLFLADFADTLIKGRDYLHSLGPLYYTRTISGFLFSAAAIKIRNERFHEFFAVFALLFEIVMILKFYLTVS